MAKNKLFVGLMVGVVALSLLGLTGLFNVPFGGSDNSSEDNSGPKSVPCLTSEAFHIHPELTVLVNGQKEAVPANIGIVPGCTRELHTHATDGVIHVESAVDRGYVFTNFLAVWGKSLERGGYDLKITVDGAETTDPNFILKDGQEIILEYTSL
ncbi:MAG: hypothetical protein HYS89_00610 [Candidatus Colwellbacteria bacterium]|nr:hypothetical protein [Candidatus Colwellbacteria bacterium]